MPWLLMYSFPSLVPLLPLLSNKKVSSSEEKERHEKKKVYQVRLEKDVDNRPITKKVSLVEEVTASKLLYQLRF
jgi:hypothetical protein